MKNSFNNSPQASPNLSKAPPVTVTTLAVHQDDSNSTWANSQKEEEEIEFEDKDAANNESEGNKQDSLTTNRFIKNMTQIKISKGRTYPTIETLFETEIEDNGDESSIKTKRTTKSSNNHTVTSSSNQTVERTKRDAPSNEDTIENGTTSGNSQKITTMVTSIKSQLGMFTDPPEAKF